MTLRTVRATRYVTPLREGGSLPGLMEADDLGTYVVKFRGAGQGPPVLVAEVICGELARSLGLPVPELALVELDVALAAGEPDPDVQGLLRSSGGVNLGVDYLPGALDFDPAAFRADPELAGRVLWFDALIGNVDRSWRNPNMLYWHRRPYLIDHGSALTFQYHWAAAGAAITAPYDAGDHVLIGCEPDVAAADAALAGAAAEAIDAAVAAVPPVWLGDVPAARYADWLTARLAARASWLPDPAAAVPAPAPKPRPSWVER